MAIRSLEADLVDQPSAYVEGGQVFAHTEAASLTYDDTKVSRRQALELFRRLRLQLVKILSGRN